MVDSVSVFFSYSHVDEPLRDALDVHMAPLRRGRLISSWHDRKIGAGTEWDAAINAQMQAADIIVLLLSPDFFNSDYCHDTEIPMALARHASGEAVVIPVILRPFSWYESPVKDLQSIPRDKKAVTLWDNRDLAYQTVVEGIREAATRMLELRRQQALQREANHDRYRTKVLESLSDGRISLPERETLDELRDELKLSAAEAKAIEVEAAEPLRKYGEDLEKYKRTLLKVIDEEYPIGAQMRADLKLRRRDLGLKDEDADRVEAPILAEAEARHQQRLAAPPAPAPAPSPVPAPTQPPPLLPPLATGQPVSVEVAADPFADLFAPLPAAMPAPLPAPVPAYAPEPEPEPEPEPPQVHVRHDVGDLVAAALADSGLGGDLHLAPGIPPAKLDKASRSCRLPAGETVLGLLDLTIFGSASDALLICAEGLDYHHDNGDPHDYHLVWAHSVDMALEGATFTVVDSTHVRTPDGVSLYVPCSVSAADLAKLLADIHGRVVDDAAAAVPDEAAAQQQVLAGPVIVAPSGAQAQEQAVWSHLLADMKADLNDTLSHLLYDRNAGTDLRVFALAGDARADLLCAFVGDAGDLLVAVWGNKELPQALSLAHPARKRLTDELGFHVLTGQGLAFARGFGPVGEVDVDEVVAVLADLIFSVFDLPRGSLAVSWELVGR